MYQCPRCSAELQTILYTGVEVETCPVCEGEWLDAEELGVIVQNAERKFTREEIAELDRARSQIFHLGPQAPERISCPKCYNRKLVPFNYASTSGIILDKCRGCGGIWLDKGELERIQALVDEWNGYLYQNKVRYAPVAARLQDEEEKAQAAGAVKSRFSFVMTVLRAFR